MPEQKKQGPSGIKPIKEQAFVKKLERGADLKVGEAVYNSILRRAVDLMSRKVTGGLTAYVFKDSINGEVFPLNSKAVDEMIREGKLAHLTEEQKMKLADDKKIFEQNKEEREKRKRETEKFVLENFPAGKKFYLYKKQYEVKDVEEEEVWAAEMLNPAKAKKFSGKELKKNVENGSISFLKENFYNIEKILDKQMKIGAKMELKTENGEKKCAIKDVPSEKNGWKYVLSLEGGSGPDLKYGKEEMRVLFRDRKASLVEEAIDEKKQNPADALEEKETKAA